MKINKIEVSRGIYWIEIADVNLRILCGCPADAVKHLIKRGLIFSREIKGVLCETGPNSILLSDVLFQNGEFSNLAEFPVLQMIYKQGLIVPNHPNNTGEKPLLIGTSEQVIAQMRYIYRGNYGLVSKEEMMQASISEQQADEMMRLKLKFAFGSIRPTSDFIDTIAIDNSQKTEIKHGVFITRLDVNVFEVSYQDEVVTVDLNLLPAQNYECVYQVGFRRFEPEYFAVIHSGEGDGWDPNRPHMSSLITYQGKVYLIDAGPALSNKMIALGIGVNQIDGFFHTHAHDDHFAGLTTLMQAGRKIRYFATPLVRASVEKKLAALFGDEVNFNDFFDVQDLVFDEWNDIDGLEVMPLFSPHPVETNIFAFRALWADGYKSYAHFADIVSLSVLKGMITEDSNAPGLSLEFFNHVRNYYLAPYDLKKVDIGGGMIHGDTKDFYADSSRVLLAHRATELSPEEKEIGSCASFGTVDVLIKGLSDGFRRQAFAYIEDNLPGIKFHDVRMLINHQIHDINPGSILIKEGEAVPEILLLVSGQVEKIRTRDNLFGHLSAGSFIGDEMILGNQVAQYTYRALSFLRVLRLPLRLYIEVIARNGLFESVRRFIEIRSFLRTTNLFSEGLPVDVMRKITDNVYERTFQTGEWITGEDLTVLNVIYSGSIERQIGSKVLNILKSRDFFGEEFTFLNIPSLFQLRALEETKVLQIPSALVANIPVLRWKILDNHQKQVKFLVRSQNDNEMFVWQESFAINVMQMDEQHKRLIHIANTIMEHLYNHAEHQAIENAFDALVDYTHYHFAEEEKLLALYNYPATQTQHRIHEQLIKQVVEYKNEILNGNVPNRATFLSFISRWLMRHVLDEDRKYGTFLNTKGIY